MFQNIEFHRMIFCRSEGGWTCTTSINLEDTKEKGKANAVIGSVFAATQREGKEKSAAMAVENLRKHCNVIEVPYMLQNRFGHIVTISTAWLRQ